VTHAGQRSAIAFGSLACGNVAGIRPGVTPATEDAACPTYTAASNLVDRRQVAMRSCTCGAFLCSQRVGVIPI
jgi:hypothetical protein